MLPPLAQNTSTTPISEPPATTPDATGKVNSSASFGFRLSSRRRNQGPQEEQKPIVPVEHPSEAERCRRGEIPLVFWQQNRREREHHSDDTAGKYQPQLDGLKRGETMTERDGNSRPSLRGGRWELVGPEHLRVRHQDCKREHGDDRTDEDAGELGKKLLTGVRTKQVAALQVGEQVGR